MSIVYRHIPQIRNKYGKFVELTLPIGSVDLVPSRDSLKSTDRTKAELERAAKVASKEYDEAMKLFEEKELRCREVGNMKEVGRVLTNQGAVRLQQGQWEDAFQLFEQAETAS